MRLPVLLSLVGWQKDSAHQADEAPAMEAEDEPGDDSAVKVAVVGATGGIGAHVVRLALERGWHVVACSRDPSRVVQHASDRLETVEVDLTAPDAEDLLADGIRGSDFVFSCIGTPRGEDPVVARGTRTILGAMGKSDVPRMCIISSVGIRGSGAQLRRAGPSGWVSFAVLSTLLSRMKIDLTRAEELVIGKAHARPDGVSCVVVRPAGLSYAPRQGQCDVAGPDGNVGICVSREDVAEFMISLVHNKKYDNRPVSIGGHAPRIYRSSK
jgi:nucleoside-diphosphate-sugar epimerase